MNGILFIVNQMSGRLPEMVGGSVKTHLLVSEGIKKAPEVTYIRPRKAMLVSDEELRIMFKQGVPYSVMEGRAGISKTAIKARMGGERRNKKRTPEYKIKQAVKMRAEGILWKDISQRLNVPLSSIAQAVRERGDL